MEKFDNRLHYDLTVQMKPLRGYKGSKADHYYLSKLLDAGIEKRILGLVSEGAFDGADFAVSGSVYDASFDGLVLYVYVVIGYNDDDISPVPANDDEALAWCEESGIIDGMPLFDCLDGTLITSILFEVADCKHWVASD